MAIEVWLLHGDRIGPVVACDKCSERIEEGSNGNVQWINEDLEGGNHRLQPFFFHKECAGAIAEVAGSDDDSWDSLTAFPIRLAVNLGLPVTEHPDSKWEIKAFIPNVASTSDGD